MQALGDAQVAVYPVDARGLQSAPELEASSSRSYKRERMAQDRDNFNDSQIDEHATMKSIAAATGGPRF